MSDVIAKATEQLLKLVDEVHANYGDQYNPSTQTCSVCNVKRITNLTLKERSWQCDCCGTKHDRDLNAAMNILLEAKRITV